MRILLVLALALPSALARAPAGVVVPFAWTAGQIEVAVTVNGTPSTFVLDTGSEYSVVSERLAARLRLTAETGGVRPFASGVTLGVGRLALDGQRVMLMPFDNYYARGRQIEGLLGYDVFERYVVKVDWVGKTLTFWPPAAFAPPAAADSVPIEFAGRLPFVASTLGLAGDRNLAARLMVDTGASQSIMLRYPFAAAHGLLALATRETASPSLASGVRRMVEVPADRLTVGNWTFDRPQTLAFAEPVGSAGFTATDGLIGNTLLSRFTLYVDYTHKRLYFEPRPR